MKDLGLHEVQDAGDVLSDDNDEFGGLRRGRMAEWVESDENKRMKYTSGTGQVFGQDLGCSCNQLFHQLSCVRRYQEGQVNPNLNTATPCDFFCFQCTEYSIFI